MKTIFARILCAALFLFAGVINSQADEATVAAGDAETVAAIRAAANSWAAAWSGKDAEGYLGHYAADFTPPDNLGREAWEQQRRDRLQRPTHISIELEWIGVVLYDDGSADATFTQSYKSPTYSDQVMKTLTMVQEGGQWKISNERTGDAAAKEAALRAEAEREAAAREAALKAQAEREAAEKEAALKAQAEREAAEREAALKAQAEREVAEKEAAMREAAEKEATAVQEAAMKEAAEKEVTAVQEAAMKEAAEKEAAAAQQAAMKEAAEREAAMRAAAEEAARQAAAAYEAEQRAAASKVAAVPKEPEPQPETAPVSAVKETIAPRPVSVAPSSSTWKIAGILLFLLLAPAVVYGTLVKPRQMAVA